MRSARLVAAALALLVPPALGGCGARTSLQQGDGHAGRGGAAGRGGTAGRAAAAFCEVAEDCEGAGDRCAPVACRDGRCVASPPRVCSDGDPCTADKCDPQTGACLFPPATLDLDNDGFRGPLPGHRPGDAGSCGDDCDDTSAAARPGGVELCDGVDNDCNGIIDDDASFVPLEGSILVSDAAAPLAGAGGLASSASGFLASVNTQSSDDSKIYARALGVDGTPQGALVLVNGTTGDASGGPLVYTGDRFGLVWEDRRSGDYEIYFATLGPDGKKLREDQRLSASQGFSVNPTLGWNGSTFAAVWQDERSGSFVLLGQKLDLDGKKIGEEVEIVESFGDDVEAPSLAVATAGTALAYRVGDADDSRVEVQILGDDLRKSGPPVVLAKKGRFESPVVVYNAPNFLVTWGEREPFRLYGAVVSPGGAVLVQPRLISPAGSQNRGAVPIPLGDRAVIIYGRVGGSGYDIYSLTLDQQLLPTAPPAVVSAGLGDELPRAVALGAKGSIGVLYSGKIGDGKGGVKGAAFFSRLECRGGLVPPP